MVRCRRPSTARCPATIAGAALQGPLRGGLRVRRPEPARSWRGRARAGTPCADVRSSQSCADSTSSPACAGAAIAMRRGAAAASATNARLMLPIREPAFPLGRGFRSSLLKSVCRTRRLHRTCVEPAPLRGGTASRDVIVEPELELVHGTRERTHSRLTRRERRVHLAFALAFLAAAVALAVLAPRSARSTRCSRSCSGSRSPTSRASSSPAARASWCRRRSSSCRCSCCCRCRSSRSWSPARSSSPTSRAGARGRLDLGRVVLAPANAWFSLPRRRCCSCSPAPRRPSGATGPGSWPRWRRSSPATRCRR